MADDWVATARAADELGGETFYFGWIEVASDAQQRARKYGFDDCAEFGLP